MTLGASLIDMGDRLQRGVELLCRARQLAQDAGHTLWDFAVEIDELTAAGMSRSDLRWLAAKKLVEHSAELKSAEPHGRAFGERSLLTMSATSCFVLTDQGVAFAKSFQNATPQRPRWDATRRELFVGDQLVKRFRVPAANQERILMAFEEEEWPTHIDDPLPPSTELSSKRRLHAAIQSLNRNQFVQRIHFSGNGTADGVCWECVAWAAT